MPLVRLVEVTAAAYVVEFPDKCPKCEADFRELNALTFWEYNDVGVSARLRPAEGESISLDENYEDDYKSLLTNRGAPYTSGEDYIGPLIIFCRKCSWSSDELERVSKTDQSES